MTAKKTWATNNYLKLWTVSNLFPQIQSRSCITSGSNTQVLCRVCLAFQIQCLFLWGFITLTLSGREISVPSTCVEEELQCRLVNWASWSSHESFCVWYSWADTLSLFFFPVPAGIATEAAGTLLSLRLVKTVAHIWPSEVLQMTWPRSSCWIVLDERSHL